MHARESGSSLDGRIIGCGLRDVASAFAVHFRELIGETPLEYLSSWRMQKAAALLEKSDKKQFEVAKSVGYDSDASFQQSF
jgi:transcriptional regulator GlxA family with amidase domain